MNDTSSRNATIVFAGVFIVLSIAQLAIGNIDFTSHGLGILTAAGVSLAMFSFLYADNPMFKIAEHTYVGISAGYTTALIWYSVILGDFVNPLFLSDDPLTLDAWLLIVPAILGIMLVMRIVPGLSWMSRISFAFVVGFGAGISIPANIAAQLLEQLYPTIRPTVGWKTLDIVFLIIGGLLIVFAAIRFRGERSTGALTGWIGPLVLAAIFIFSFFASGGGTALVLIGVSAVLVYFFFSVEHSGVVGAVSRIGIWFLMVAFGASFGFTIMARISLLIGRMQFLLGDWLNILPQG